MVFVESVTDVENMTRTIGNKDVWIYPILSDVHLHPCMNSVCLLAISCAEELYILSFNHNDALNLDSSILPTLRFNKIYTPSKSVLLHTTPFSDNIIDIKSVEYLSTGKITNADAFLTNCHRQLYQLYDGRRDVNTCVPIMKHIDMIEQYLGHTKHTINNLDALDPPFVFLNDIAIPTLQYIESNGLHTDGDVPMSRYVDDVGLIYSEYNLYTATGRPSNRHGGINFAALNKKDESRKIFTSRFDRGLLVMADYESFHLRLIADIIEYPLPDNIPIHEYFGRQYFNKETITEEEYAEGKQLTFQLLYSEIRDADVPDFFKKVYEYIDALWSVFNQRGYIVSPYYHRKFHKSTIESPTPAKLFNYIIQLAETEHNLTAINQLRPIFENKQSKPILYTYDSILFDYNIDDEPSILVDSVNILSQNGKFPMRLYVGRDYDDMKQFNM